MHADYDIDLKIDAICEEYEGQLRDGRGDDLSGYLASVDSEFQQKLFRQLLLLKWDYETPDPDLDAIRYPRFAVIIRDCQRTFAPIRREPLQPGMRVGRYTIQRMLGAGAFADVYCATDDELQRHVAIKSPKLGAHPTHADAERFLGEAKALANLSHSNIVTIHDIITDSSGWPLLVIEYLSAEPMDVHADRERVLAQLIDVAEAMDYVHTQGYVHRDLKPENILIEACGRAYVSDFGLSLHEDSMSSQRGKSVGTLQYMSPELVRGESHWIDGRSDIWSLGVILYEVLSGSRPFVSDDVQAMAELIVGRSPKPPRQINPECPEVLEQICLRCLRKNPEDRYQTAKDVADALRRFRSVSSRSGASVPLNRRLIIAAVVAVVLLLAAFFTPTSIKSVFWSRLRGGAVPVTPTDTANADPSSRKSVPSNTFVEVIRHQAAGIEWLPLPDAVPLHAGDRLAISVNVGQPMYRYVLWMDSDGSTTQLYPRGQTDICERDPAGELVLPPTWSLSDGPSGSATLVVLGSVEPVDVNLTKLFSKWRPQPSRLHGLVYTDFGRLLSAQNRSVMGSEREFSWPVAENQRLFRQPAFQCFSLCRSICIPFVSDASD